MSEIQEELKVIRARLMVALHTQDKVAQVYADINKLLAKYPHCVQLLVYKSQAIQGLSEGSEALLENAKDALRAAIKLDPDYIPALIEMGWFVFAHEDNAKRANKYFLRALKLANNHQNDCLRWIGDCMKELRLKKGHGHKKKS